MLAQRNAQNITDLTNIKVRLSNAPYGDRDRTNTLLPQSAQ